MDSVEQQQGGLSSSRRKKHAAKSKPQPANDWPRSSEPRSRASPRQRRHGDIDMDVVESPDEAESPNPQRRRRRRQAPPAAASDSSTATTPSTPTKTPHSTSMRTAHALDTASTHRRPTCVIEEDDDDEDAAPSGPSRPVSRQTISRRDTSPRSAHRYRSTPESRRSPRTSLSDSDDDTGATSDSEEEHVVKPRGKQHPPPAPIAPPVPSAPPAPAIHSSLQERLNRRPEMVYEEDPDGTSRYAQSVGTRRSRSRSRSRARRSRRDQYRRPRDISISGPPSLDETRSRSRSKRPSRRHYGSDVYTSRPSSSFKTPHASSHSLSSSAKRSTFFGDYAASSVHPSRAEKPVERLTVCAVCRNDNTPVSKTVKLKCCHRMCHSCLCKVFKLSLTDPQHMPPRCCTTDEIPFKYVEALFDYGFKREWKQRYLEYSARSRGLFCPSQRCRDRIRPEDMRRDGGRTYARCRRCRTKVCGSCGDRWHPEPDCPRDDETTQFPEQGKRGGWQRCRRCKAMVELKEGRDHMTCRCGAEVCAKCGGKWKTCDCPRLNHDPFEGDATGHAVDPRPNPFASAPSYESRSVSPQFRPEYGAPPVAAARPRPSSYEEEAYLRRLQEQRDEHLARRMHSFDAFGRRAGHADFDRGRLDYELDEPREPRERRRRAERSSAPFVDDDYHRRAATVVAPSPPQTHLPAAPPPPHSAFEPPSRPSFDRSSAGFDYGSTVHRSRGMRYASPERYGDYVTENYTPERRRPRSSERWHAFSQERRPRSPGAPHVFPSESRPASPETWQQLPTRYPSPERPVPTSEERRRAPSPNRRRTSSLERRLAERFKPESRQSPAAPIAPVGPLGPLSPTRGVPPPPSRAATLPIGTGMAPMPPPTASAPVPPPLPTLRRHHTMDEDVYAPPPAMHGGPPIAIPPTDWFGRPPGPPPGLHMPMHAASAASAAAVVHESMVVVDGINGPAGGGGGGGGKPPPRVAVVAPTVRRRPPQAHHREHNNKHAAAAAVAPAPRSSVLAGLAGMGRGMHRVSEWVNYVEIGAPPEGEQASTVVQ